MKKKYLIILILILILAFSLYLFSIGTRNIFFNSPDENINHLFITTYGETGNLFFKDEIISSGGERALPRGLYFFNDKIVPLKFLGLSIFYGAFYTLNKELIYYLTPILASLILLFIFFMGKDVFKNRKYALIVTSIVMISPFFLYWGSHNFFENLASSAFFIFSLYFFLKIFSEKDNYSYYILSGLFIAVSVGIRYDMGLLFLILVAMLGIFFRKLNPKGIMLFFITFLIAFAPFLYLNNLLYGNPFMYHQEISSGLSGKISERSISNFLFNYGSLFLFVPVFIFSILGMLNTFMKKEAKPRILVFILFLYFIIFGYLIVSEFVISGNIINHSYSRYALSFFILSNLFFIPLFKNLNNKKILAFFILSIFVISLITSLTYLDTEWERRERNQDLSEKIFNNTLEDSIIIVNRESKFLYPDRKTVSIRSYFEGGVLNKEAILKTTEELKERNYKLYIYSANEETDEILNFLKEKFNMSKTNLNDLYEIK